MMLKPFGVPSTNLQQHYFSVFVLSNIRHRIEFMYGWTLIFGISLYIGLFIFTLISNLSQFAFITWCLSQFMSIYIIMFKSIYLTFPYLSQSDHLSWIPVYSHLFVYQCSYVNHHIHSNHLHLSSFTLCSLLLLLHKLSFPSLSLLLFLSFF